MNTLLKREKNENLNQHVISCLSGNPAECKSLLNIMPLDSRVKPENDKEVGRSMVEMLGVLAVMGVLSVAGIAGYNNAMNRHRANELINEASKRATIVAAQVLQGRTTFSIDEFSATNEKLGFTGVQENPKNPQQFQLKLSGVDEKVCTQMRDLVGTNTPVREINENCTIITYNKDLSTTIYASDFNADTTGQKCLAAGFTWCPKWGSGTCSENSDCCAHQEISECQQCNSETGEISGDYTKNAEPCDYDGDGDKEDGLCRYDGVCVERYCLTNEDCATLEPTQCRNGGCFCDNSGVYVTVASRRYSFLTGGRCALLNDYPGLLSAEGKASDGNVVFSAGQFLMSTKYMSFWSAQNWCQAQTVNHKSWTGMVTRATLGVSNCGHGSTCVGPDWNNLKEVFSGGGNEYYWIQNSSVGATAWVISPFAEKTNTGAYPMIHYALCE